MTRTSRPPWLIDALDVAERRSVLLRSIVAGVCVAGVVLAIVAPGLVPRTALVGALVAVVAIVVGVAATSAVDAGDAVVRGPRHVRAAGGELVGVLPTEVSADGARDLAESVLAVRAQRRLTLGLAGASREVPIPAWAEALATAIARADASVLVVDLASGATPEEGLLEVVRDEVSLASTVTFETQIKLARLGAGRDLDAALRAAAVMPGRLPKDLEVLLVALPPIAAGDVLSAAAALDAVLLVARTGATQRVRLQAAIEAVEATGTAAQVVLVDERLATSTPDAPTPVAPAPAHAEPAPTSAEPSTDRDGPDPGPPAAEDGVDPLDPDDHGAPPDDGEDGAEDGEASSEAAPAEPAAPATAQPAADLGRRPGPSVRVVRDLPPTRPRRPLIEPDLLDTADPDPPSPLSFAPDPFARRPDPFSSVDDPGTVDEPEPVDESAHEPTPPVVRRDPEVLAGAEVATAAAELAAVPAPVPPPVPVPGPEPAPEPEPEPDPEPVLEPQPDDDRGLPAPEPVVVPDPKPEPGPVVVPVPEPQPVIEPEPGAEPDPVAESTDEMQSVAEPRELEEDPLRTTAQLALLLDELHGREPPSA